MGDILVKEGHLFSIVFISKFLGCWLSIWNKVDNISYYWKRGGPSGRLIFFLVPPTQYVSDLWYGNTNTTSIFKTIWEKILTVKIVLECQLFSFYHQKHVFIILHDVSVIQKALFEVPGFLKLYNVHSVK